MYSSFRDYFKLRKKNNLDKYEKEQQHNNWFYGIGFPILIICIILMELGYIGSGEDNEIISEEMMYHIIYVGLGICGILLIKEKIFNK